MRDGSAQSRRADTFGVVTPLTGEGGHVSWPQHGEYVMAKSMKPIQIVATFVSPGVTKGAAGFVIVGGKIIKIPPRGAAFKQLAETAAQLAVGR